MSQATAMLDRHPISNACVAVLTLLLGAGSCLAAEALKLPVRIDTQLAAGQHHLYHVAIQGGQTAEFSLVQHDATLQLRATDDAGMSLPIMQDDAGRNARLRLTVSAAKRTVWAIDIAASDAKQPARYLFTGGTPHATSAIDRAHAVEEQALAEAENLRRANGSPEHGNASKANAPAIVLAKYQSAFDVAQHAGDTCIELMADAGRARYEFALGDYQASRKAASEALRYRCGVAADASAAAEEAVAQRTLGSAAGYLGDFTAATAAQERALTLYRQTGDPKFQAMALGNLSADYRVTGATHKALDTAASALKLAQDMGDRNRAVFARESIAAIHLQRGEWGQALAVYHETLDALRTSPYPLIEGMTWTDLGQLYGQLGENQESQHAFQQAETAWTRIGDLGGLAETLLDEADLAFNDGHIDVANAIYRKNLDYDVHNGLQREQSHALTGLGRCATARGDWSEARKSLLAARDLAHQIHAASLEIWATEALGDLESRQHHNADALTDYLDAYALAQRANDFNSQVVLLGNRARIALDAGDTEAARKLIAPAIDLIENEQAQIDAPALRTHYFASLRAYYDLYIDILMRRDHEHPGNGYAITALTVSEQARARALRDQLRERNVVVAPHAAPELIAAEQAAEDALRQAAWRRAQVPTDAAVSAREQAQRDVDGASHRLDDARGQVRAADPRYAELAHPAPLDMATLQRTLLDDDVVVFEYWLGESRSYRWRITRNTVQGSTLPARASMEKSADALRAALLAPQAIEAGTSFNARAKIDAAANVAVRRQSLALGKILLPASDAADPRTHVVIADGELQRLPFNLFDPSPEHAYVYLPSLATLRELRAVQTHAAHTESIAVFADPVFSEDDPRLQGRPSTNQPASQPGSQLRTATLDTGIDALSRLPSTQDEAAQIAALMPVDDRWIETGFAASRANALTAPWARYSLVHFATHAMMDLRHPELSGVVLSLYDEQGHPEDGILRMQDIYNLRMPADLVTLSVCDSSREPSRGAEGIFGLSRAFFHAGARRLLVSLWPVDDRASARLMSLFYRNLLARHQSPQVALQSAQLETSRDPRWQSPYYWSGFVIQGDWR